MMIVLRRLEAIVQGQVMVTLEAMITCPLCGAISKETMPTDACQYFYECKGCGVMLKPRSGDCCVYCSYADVPCPPMQEERSGCCMKHDS